MHALFIVFEQLANTKMKSNRNGRALEYLLVEKFTQFYCSPMLSAQTEHDQCRDRDHYHSLPIEMQRYYSQHCETFVQWVKEHRVADEGSVEIIRISDHDAVKGDVTDIRLVTATEQYNLSLKHNNNAVKHQRPGNLFAQLGIANKAEEKRYRAEITVISNQFFARASQYKTDLFNVVKSHDESIILSFYDAMCQLVVDTINSQPVSAEESFDFLVGNCNFDKVIISRDYIEVLPFSDIIKPTLLTAKQTSHNHIQLDFDNGFSFDMRLHTASSRFSVGKTINQKFDTRLISDSVKRFFLS